MDKKQNYYLTEEMYQALYDQSIENPEQFWAHQATHFLDWYQPWQTVQSGSFKDANIRWFIEGKLNASYNCIDRHLKKHADEIAIIWESDSGESKKITYRQLHREVSKLANLLKKLSIQKGDRVCIYLPMIPEAVYAMLACARIGAIHSVVFAGFSAHALENRIQDADCSLLVTADEAIRGGKITPLKQQADEARKQCPSIKHVLVVKRTGSSQHEWDPQFDIWYDDAIQSMSDENSPEVMDSEDPLFILYTSGSTGKPKGILHTTGGYLLYSAITHHYIFDYQPHEVYWCTADIGWITGHSYLVYGPLANGATTLLFEGTPTYPTASRCWEIVDKHQVNIFYTAPTVIRTLMREGTLPVKRTKRDSLRILGSVGEPINKEAWEWYFNNVGEHRCPIVDTWWQTETGGALISPLPGLNVLKPGSAMRPFFGIKPAIVDENGQLSTTTGQGKLVITGPWPGMLRGVYKNPERYVNAYFADYPGCYLTGDNARIDDQGDFWILGRIDDVINVAGHRLSTAEIESAITEHPAIAEAAVVGIPDVVKGQAIYAFITPKLSEKPSEKLANEIKTAVRESIGALAVPQFIQWADALPKTRSGKIMRRILRNLASNQLSDLGDTSTLADSNVIETLIQEKHKQN